MNLLCVNLQPPSAISLAVNGNFSAPKAQEIAAIRGNNLVLLRPDENGRILTIASMPAFSIIRSIITFRLAGANRDYVVLGSDSGKISILEFDTNLHEWKVVHCETFGKTGCRRIVPGQYLAADPKGRAIMIGAIEKQKFVYVMNRDSNNKLTISSPLEGHRNETIVFSICGVDVAYENPIFALIELEYGESDQDPTGEAYHDAEKKLSYYELDLGLNHVVRKWSEPISRTANFLLAVPGGDNWPSGVLICGENWVSYKHQGHVEVRAPLPRRHDLPPERGVLITTGTLHKQKDLFFFLIQSEYGDIYKVTFELEEGGKVVQDIIVSVFDTIPVANSLCITKSGFLFAACEAGNHLLLQFQGLDNPNAVRSQRIADDELNEQLGDDSFAAARVAPLFKATNKLQDFIITEESQSLSPITDMLVEDLFGEGVPQLYTLCGRNNRSTLRTLRRGISASELAVTELPGRPAAVWTLKRNNDDEYDSLIIVSFSNATLVLGIGETVEEITDSGFITNSPTLQICLLADNSVIQVHPNGIRHVRSSERINEWKCPSKRNVQTATVNSRQVAIALTGGEIIYFEIDETGSLFEMGTVDMGKEVSCLDLGVVDKGEARSMFLAIGYWDDTCQLLTLDPRDVLGRGPSFKVETRPTSISLVEMVKELPSTDVKKKEADLMKSLYLFIGEERGVLHRLSVDPITGDFSDPRQKFLGPKSVKLCRVHVQSHSAVMALSSRTWLSYNFQNKYHQDPISYEPLEFVSDLSSEMCPQGLVAVAGQSLRIISIENLGMTFNQQSTTLQYTPRKLVRIPNTTDLAVIETDHNEFITSEKPTDGMDVVEENNEDEEGTTVTIKGPIPALPNHWASGIRIYDAASASTKGFLELESNEAAYSITTCRFIQHSEEVFLAVGTTVGLQIAPRKVSHCYINLYRNIDGTLQLLHKTEVEEVPYAMIEFQGKLLVGIGKSLRLYDLGKKKLLKKCENKSLPSQVVRLSCQGDRIYVGDQTQSVLMVKYRRTENLFSVFADDTVPRFITCMTVMDHNTVACGDKFGNIMVLRLPETANDDLTVAGNGNIWDQGQPIPNKLEAVTKFYLGEIPMSIQKTSMKYKGKEVLLVGTICGSIYAFVPARSKEETNFFQLLEMFMRQEHPNLTHRDHLSFRSSFQPVKNTVDGMLCDRFVRLPLAKQNEFAESVDRSVVEVMKKIEDALDFL